MAWLSSRTTWWLAGLGVLVMAGGFGYVKGHRAGVAQEQLQLATLTAQYASAQAAAEAAARTRQAALQNQIAAVDAQHAQELHDAQAKSNAVIADLRTGAVRLRQQWRGCEASPSVPAAAASASQPDDAAHLRAAGAADLVRAAATADAQIRALQAVVKADRQ